jgi:hypothetical protein
MPIRRAWTSYAEADASGRHASWTIRRAMGSGNLVARAAAVSANRQKIVPLADDTSRQLIFFKRLSAGSLVLLRGLISVGKLTRHLIA